MIIMGCVKQITATSIRVALPGRIDGTVDVSSISQTYLNLAERFVSQEADQASENEENEYQALNDLFQIGQIVCVKVMKIDASKPSKVEIALSMQPKDIHADFQHDAVKSGMVLSVAIAERQEHGFVIETGIKNLRGFLKKQQLHGTAASSMIIGMVYTCRVMICIASKEASTATFELITKSKEKLVKFDNLDVSYVLPGIVTKFHVTKRVKNGLQGTVFDNNLVAYINEHQLGFHNKKVGIIRKAKDFEIGDDLTARVLYVMPLTKIVYLSLNTDDKFLVQPHKTENFEILPIGTIIENAIVSHIGTGGIVLKLPKAKGIVSLRSLHSNIKTNFDQDEVLSKYQRDSVHKVRVIHYDPIDLLHVCSVDKQLIQEKLFSVNDVTAGDMVDAVIKRKLKDGRIEVRVGRIKGFIHPSYLSKATTAKQLEEGKRLRCRVVCINSVKHEIFLTNSKELLVEKAPLLTDKDSIAIGSTYIGLIKKCLPDGWIIGFFDYLTGMIYRNNLTVAEQGTAERFYEGQLLKVTIKAVKNENGKKHIALGLADFSVDIGAVHKGIVAAIQPTGIDVAFPEANLNGFIPVMYLSDFPSLIHGLYNSYQVNDDVEAIGVAAHCYSIRDVRNLENSRTTVKKLAEVRIGDIIPAFIKNVNNELIEVQCFLKDFKPTVKIHLKMFVENYERASDVTLVPDQKIFVKILAKNIDLKTVTCSAQLSDVWVGDFKQTAQIQRRYFADVERIKSSLKATNPLKNYQTGQIITAKHTTSDRLDHTVAENRKLRTFLTDDEIKVYVTCNNDAYRAKDEQHKILIVWIDYANGVMYGTMKKQYLDRTNNKQDESSAAQQLTDHPGLKADVLLISDEMLVLYPRKWTNRFIYVPKRFHYNDFQSIVVKGVQEGSLVNVTTIDVAGDHFIGMLHSLFDFYSKRIDQKLDDLKKKEDVEMKDEGDIEEKSSKKRKQSNAKEKSKNKKQKLSKRIEAVVNVEDDDDNDITPAADLTPTQKSKAKAKKLKNQEQSTPAKPKKKFSMLLSQMDGAMDLGDSDSDESDDEKDDKLPGVSNFWSSDLSALNASEANQQSSDSSSEEDEDTSAKKIKLTSKERFTAARNEEARIREIERSYADDNVQPTTIDQFDRLVMAEPNNSRAWVNYMVFHVQATEIDRARAIAQKALKTIDIREAQERLNIWVAMLNLELRFGSKDAFDDALKEALLVNEPFKVYSICLKIFADCKRVQELCDMVLTVTKKFRQNPECWLNAAQAFFEVDLSDKAKPLLNRALLSVPERDRKLFSNLFSLPFSQVVKKKFYMKSILNVLRVKKIGNNL